MLLVYDTTQTNPKDKALDINIEIDKNESSFMI